MESECACIDGSIGGVSFLEFKQEPESAASYAHFSSMSANEVSKWLEEIGLGEYAAKFRENDVDGECLRIFSQQEGEALLKRVIPRIGPQIKFIYSLNKLVGLKRGKSIASSSDKDMSGSIHTELLPDGISTAASNVQLGTGSTPQAVHISTIASNVQLGTGSIPPGEHMSTIASNVQLGTEPTELLSPCIFNSASSDDRQLGPELLSPVISTSDSNEAEPVKIQSVLSYQGSSNQPNVQGAGQATVFHVKDFTKPVCSKELKVMLHRIDRQSLNNSLSIDVSGMNPVTTYTEPSSLQQTADNAPLAPVICKQQDKCNGKTPKGSSQSAHIKSHKAVALELPSKRKIQKSVHTGKKTFSCDTCGKSFLFPSVLKRHIRTHTGERPYSCKICGKSFLFLIHLERHIRIHTRERPFTCDTCGKSFTQAGTLKTHKHIHAGERPFVCNTCGKRFTRSQDLTEHKRLHSGEKPIHDCTVCGKSFVTRSGLSRHKRKKHTEENNNI